MLYILFAIEEPANEHSIEYGYWNNFEYNVSKVQNHHQGIQVLGKHVFLIDRSLGMQTYNALSTECEKHGLKHQAINLNSETIWK